MTRTYSRAERTLAQVILGLLTLAALAGVAYGETVLFSIGPLVQYPTLFARGALAAIAFVIAFIFDAAAVILLIACALWTINKFLRWATSAAFSKAPSVSHPA